MPYYLDFTIVLIVWNIYPLFYFTLKCTSVSTQIQLCCKGVYSAGRRNRTFPTVIEVPTINDKFNHDLVSCLPEGCSHIVSQITVSFQINSLGDPPARVRHIVVGSYRPGFTKINQLTIIAKREDKLGSDRHYACHCLVEYRANGSKKILYFVRRRRQRYSIWLAQRRRGEPG